MRKGNRPLPRSNIIALRSSRIIDRISPGRPNRLPIGGEIEGPAVIFQKDSTVLLPPHSRTTVEANGNLRISLAAEASMDGERMSVATVN